MDETAERFDAALLDRLTAALTKYLGPEACIVVAKAAREATEVYPLCMSVATHVPSAARIRFLHEIADLVEPAALTTDVLKRTAQRMAEHIGPLATVLVEKESRQALNPADLYVRLSRHIRNLEARRAFVAAASTVRGG